MTERLKNAIREMRKVVMCLYLELEPSIADDVSKHVEELIAAATTDSAAE